MNSPRWFVAYVRPRHESTVAHHLVSRQIENFLPTYKVDRRWSDRRVVSEQPLFPGYIFVRINPGLKMMVLDAPGVLYLVGARGCPEPLQDAEIEDLANALINGKDPRPHPFISAGDRVTITRGRLQGYEGFVVRQNNKHRVVLRMDLINKAMSVEVDAADIVPAPRRDHAAGVSIHG